MYLTTQALTTYLFNFLFIYMIIFVAALFRDIIDTVKNSTEIRILQSAIDSLFCTLILIIIYELIDISFAINITIDIIVGYNSESISKFILRCTDKDKLIHLLVSFIPIESLREFLKSNIEEHNNMEDE